MPPAYPARPGHESGTAFFLLLVRGRWPVERSGSWGLPSDNRRVLVHGAVVALLCPTKSIV